MPTDQWGKWMNKKSHVLITKKVTENIPERGRMWFLLGSILPDLLLHTYLKGQFRVIGKSDYKNRGNKTSDEENLCD